MTPFVTPHDHGLTTFKEDSTPQFHSTHNTTLEIHPLPAMSPFNLETCARPNILALEPYRCARE
jgi:hypothetical protein